jgi:hypothetical protein
MVIGRFFVFFSSAYLRVGKLLVGRPEIDAFKQHA